MFEKHTFGPFHAPPVAGVARADLEVFGINHYRPSYVARVYVNDPDVDEITATEDRASYAGSFSIFGHQTCVGSEGHCENHPHARRFDDRPSHPLTRAFKRVVITDVLKRQAANGGPVTITVTVTTEPKITQEFDGPLFDIQGLQLATFA